MKFTGKVTKALDKSGTSKEGKPFVAWQYCLEEEGVAYPQSCLLETFGDRTVKPNIGDMVEAEFNMKCTEYNGNLYGRNNAWKITVLPASDGRSMPQPIENAPSGLPNIEPQGTSGQDDLPFN